MNDFLRAAGDAVMDSGDAHKIQMMQFLSDPCKVKMFSKVIFDILAGAARH